MTVEIPDEDGASAGNNHKVMPLVVADAQTNETPPGEQNPTIDGTVRGQFKPPLWNGGERGFGMSRTGQSRSARHYRR